MDEFSPISPMGEEDSVKPADKRKKKKKKKKSGSVRKAIAIKNLPKRHARVEYGFARHGYACTKQKKA